MSVLKQMVEVAHSDEGEGPPGLSSVHKAYQALKAREDKQYGGFGSSPKFPQPGIDAYSSSTTKVYAIISTKMCAHTHIPMYVYTAQHPG